MNPTKTVEKNKITNISTYGLALFLFLMPFEYPLADLASVSPLRIIGLLAMGLAAVDIITKRTLRLDYRVFCILLWLAYGLLTYLWSLDKNRFASFFSIYFNNALMFLLFSMVWFSEHEANILKKAMIFGVAALLLYMTFVPRAVIQSSYQDRLTLNVGEDGLDQNYLAALMVIAFGLVFYDICNNKKKLLANVLPVIFCAAIAYYVLLTGSRSGLIALLLISLLSVNTSWKTRLYIGIPLVVMLLVVLPLVKNYIPASLLDRFSLTALTGQEHESGSRLLIWKRAIDSLDDLWWLCGHGVGSSQTIIGNILGMGKDMAIHNHYLAILVETGIIGFAFINIPICMMVVRTRKIDKPTAVAFSGILLMAFFLDVLTTKFFWSAMILLSVCSNINVATEEDSKS